MDAKVLGERIRIARERLGLSQSQLGKLVSKDQRAVSEYEHGERRIWVNDLPTFAEALEVPLLYFFEGDVSPQDLEHRLINEFRKFPTNRHKRARWNCWNCLAMHSIASTNIRLLLTLKLR